MMTKSINDIIDEIEKRPKGFLKQIENWFWTFYHWTGLGSLWKLKPRFICQRLTRGFPEWHMWGLDHHLADHIAPRMRAFAEYELHGFPCEYAEKYGNEYSVGFLHWKRDVKKMAFAFEKLAEENRDWMDASEFFKRDMTEQEKEVWLKVMEVRRKFIQENVEHFGKHFLDLWD